MKESKANSFSPGIKNLLNLKTGSSKAMVLETKDEKPGLLRKPSQSSKPPAKKDRMQDILGRLSKPAPLKKETRKAAPETKSPSLKALVEMAAPRKPEREPKQEPKSEPIPEKIVEVKPAPARVESKPVVAKPTTAEPSVKEEVNLDALPQVDLPLLTQEALATEPQIEVLRLALPALPEVEEKKVEEDVVSRHEVSPEPEAPKKPQSPPEEKKADPGIRVGEEVVSQQLAPPVKKTEPAAKPEPPAKKKAEVSDSGMAKPIIREKPAKTLWKPAPKKAEVSAPPKEDKKAPEKPAAPVSRSLTGPRPPKKATPEKTAPIEEKKPVAPVSRSLTGPRPKKVEEPKVEEKPLAAKPAVPVTGSLTGPKVPQKAPQVEEGPPVKEEEPAAPPAPAAEVQDFPTVQEEYVEIPQPAIRKPAKPVPRMQELLGSDDWIRSLSRQLINYEKQYYESEHVAPSGLLDRYKHNASKKQFFHILEKSSKSAPRAKDGAKQIVLLKRNILEAIGHINEPYRSMLVNHYLRNFTVNEIVEQFQIPDWIVRERLAKALEYLNRKLEQTFGKKKIPNFVLLTKLGQN